MLIHQVGNPSLESVLILLTCAQILRTVLLSANKVCGCGFYHTNVRKAFVNSSDVKSCSQNGDNPFKASSAFSCSTVCWTVANSLHMVLSSEDKVEGLKCCFALLICFITITSTSHRRNASISVSTTAVIWFTCLVWHAYFEVSISADLTSSWSMYKVGSHPGWVVS